MNSNTHKSRWPVILLGALIIGLVILGCPTTANDTTAPLVSSVSPAAEAIDVAINSVVRIDFDELMDEATLTAESFTLYNGTVQVLGTVSTEAQAAIFTPAENLQYQTVYTATMLVTAMDISGNALVEAKVWTFTTLEAPDTTGPLVLSTSPLNSATNVPISTLVRVNFDEVIDETTLTIDSFTLYKGTVKIVGTITTEEQAAIFYPSADLEYLTEYTATMSVAAKDILGNALAEAKVWKFTTSQAPDTTAPVVLATLPQNLATDVSINTSITVTFNESMSTTSINATSFTVKAGATTVPGSITYDIPHNKAIFSPNANLLYDTEYTVTVSTAVTDVVGNNLVSAKIWTFHTPVVVGAGPAPVRLGTAGNFVILAKTAITNVPTSLITGDIGLSPAAESYITGFPLTKATGYSTAPEITGFVYAADMTPPTPSNMTIAIGDMEAAYTDAAGRPSVPADTNLGGGTIGGLTFVPGVYTWGSTVQIDQDITIAGGGGSDDVWIFQITQDLIVASGKKVILTNGAQAKNIFWQVAEIVRLGTGSNFQGIILSQTQIQIETGATLTGRALAQTQVTLDQNTVTAPAQ